MCFDQNQTKSIAKKAKSTPRNLFIFLIITKSFKI